LPACIDHRVTTSLSQANAAPRQSAAWLNIAAKVGGAGFSFLLYIVLARTMTPEGLADFAVVFALLNILTAVGCLSSPLVLMRFVPASLASGHPGLARGVV